MKQLSWIAGGFALVSLAFGQGVGEGPKREDFEAQGPPARAHFARGHASAKGAKPASPNLIYHGGPILTETTTQAIFWGTSWNNPNFVQDKITGLESFYTDVIGSSYADTNKEYTQADGQHVSSKMTHLAPVIDLTAAPSRTPRTSQVLGAVCKNVANPVANGYYAVYIDKGRSGAAYCAWHSYGSCGGDGPTFQFAFFFNLDGDPGCSVGAAVGSHQAGVAALVNVSGHELSEAMTDPHLDAWTDAQGEENADKCAWTFSGTLLLNSGWRIQGNWSNAAYGAATGYADPASGLTVRGCIDGH